MHTAELSPIGQVFTTTGLTVPTGPRGPEIQGLRSEKNRNRGRIREVGLAGRKGQVAMLGLTEHYIDQQAFAGFRSVTEKAGLTLMEPQNDRGDSAIAARVAATILQATPDLVGMAGFDSESGPGMGLAIKEAGKAGQIVATCVDAEPAHLSLIKEGVLTAAIGQKRELFTYFGLRILFELNHSPLRLCADDKAAGIRPAPDVVYTGSYTVTRENVDIFIKRQQPTGPTAG